jgi:hypothetical protein
MTHAVAGAAVASLVPQYPVLAFCAAFASHFLLDAIPHKDYAIASASINPQIGAPIKYDRAFMRDVVFIGGDALAGLGLSFLVFSPSAPFLLIGFGAFAGILPDPLQFVYTRLRYEPLISLQRFHRWIHTKQRMKNSLLLGIVSQALLLLVIIVVTKWLIG